MVATNHMFSFMLCNIRNIFNLYNYNRKKLLHFKTIQIVLIIISLLDYPFLNNLFVHIIFGYFVYINRKKLEVLSNNKLIKTK